MMSSLSLPPGFRFHPTDEELIESYLSQKLKKNSSSDHIPPNSLSIIPEVDIYKFDPWDLPDKAAFGEKEWYFFSHRNRKYPNGKRPNRAAASGYWKATGTDKQIIVGKEQYHDNLNGIKKSLVFYKGKPPKGVKTNWIMHEYRLTHPLQYSSIKLDEWVLCRIYKKCNAHDNQEEETYTAQDHHAIFHQQHSLTSSFSDDPFINGMDYSLLNSFLSNDDQHHPISECESFDLKHPSIMTYTNKYGNNINRDSWSGTGVYM
ncbi:hypothetical protein Sjap_012120 [Stephania japonica]|uniref:NAC domain-containing protein n=1 Tax=Stephania japonica TaxID=461633 RepID=A0AAP0IVG4_9MAGN